MATGQQLLRKWKIPAQQAFHHRGGTFFMPLTEFPGALCDLYGYVLFQTYDEYVSSPFLSIGKRLNVRSGVHRLPGYTLCRPPT
ncbi:hypothetical protein [Lysobacter sp. CA199]|uniref:hypothetical protein n=1 Tax=Lysobacter sp. CA199 TaxID=3455608 RepID=UPI003F8D433D